LHRQHAGKSVEQARNAEDDGEPDQGGAFEGHVGLQGAIKS
jgi:hypothetical protein